MNLEERLIEKVSEHEALYNTDSPGYRDQRVRNAAWREVGRCMNMPASNCREIWARLRNCYTNAIKRRLPLKNGQPLKKFPKWKFEDQMSFLVPFLIIRSTHDTISDDLSDNHYDQQTEHFLDDSTQHNPKEEYQNNLFELYPSISTVTSSQKRKKPTEMSAEDVFQILETNASFQKEKEFKKHIDLPTLDSTELFYLSMARTVKKMPVVEQVRIRMELCRLVSEAELRCLDINPSVKTNSEHVEHPMSPDPNDTNVQYDIKLN